MYRRNLSHSIREALADRPVVFIHGARQTGKSTLVQSLISRSYPARYLTLDDTTVLAAARTDPDGFVAGLEGPVILDEVQRAPALFLAIKAAVDRDRRPGRFLLTGSANVLVLPRLSEALAGRMEILTLWPLSAGELDDVREGFVDAAFSPQPLAPIHDPRLRPALLARALRGGYPEVIGLSSAARRLAWFGSYLATLLQRDVRDLSNIEGLTDLPRLLALLSARATGLLNYAEVSRSMNLPQTTLKRYMALLEATFLVQTLPAWAGSLSRRLVRSSKLLLSDTGLMAHLLGLDAERLASDPALCGPMVEGFVAMELKKQLGWSQTQAKVFHFRTQTGQEVDIVLEDAAGRVVGVEVKAAGTVNANDLKGLRALAEAAGRRFWRGIVLYTGSETVPFAKNLHAMPASAVWRLGTTGPGAG